MFRRRLNGGGPYSVTSECFIEREDCEITLEVSGSWRPGCEGRTNGPPEDCYPPEGPEAEVEDAIVIEIVGENGPVKEAYGWKVGQPAKFPGSKEGPTLTEKEIESFIDELIEQGYADEQSEYEAACEAQYDAMKEEGLI